MPVDDRCLPAFRELIERCCIFQSRRRPKIRQVVAALEAIDVPPEADDQQHDAADDSKDAPKGTLPLLNSMLRPQLRVATRSISCHAYEHSFV